MSELAEPLRRVLGETGYFGPDGRPAASTVTICNGDEPRRGTFKPDVRWDHANLTTYFKFKQNPAPEVVGTWQREVWNEGSVPLLWIVEPRQTTLYNGFAVPQGPVTARQLDVFTYDLPTVRTGADAPRLGLRELTARAGRLSMETGRFWQEESRVNREQTVDTRLLRDMEQLEDQLRGGGLSVARAQGLISRTIFAQYLVDRGIITKQRLRREYRAESLPDVLRDRQQAKRLFRWLVDTFNGDMFPNTGVMPAGRHLNDVAAFLEGEASGQGALFPYRFDLIPVELISAIYEQFVHAADPAGTRSDSVFYTPLSAVSLIMNELMQDISGDETVLDITCGSGVFLVEALRRLVSARTDASPATRATVRDVLYNQICGVDISASAVQVAAFSLYLEALELERELALRPGDTRGLRFRHLVGKTLLVGDAHRIEQTPAGRRSLVSRSGPRKFDIIVGNPPWSFGGRAGTAKRRTRTTAESRSPRGVSLDFVERAEFFSHDQTKFGLVLSATPFFSRSETGLKAAQAVVKRLAPVTLVNLSDHAHWLFRRPAQSGRDAVRQGRRRQVRGAQMPAVVLFGRGGHSRGEMMRLIQVPWALSGKEGGALGVVPAHVKELDTESWIRQPELLKCRFFGEEQDIALLNYLQQKYRTLNEELAEMNTALRTGLTLGNRTDDAMSLEGMKRLWDDGRRGQEPCLERFRVRQNLPLFNNSHAEKPRAADTFRAPLVIVKEGLERSLDGLAGPRPVVAVAEEDIVFKNAYFGISLAGHDLKIGHLLAGILSSALAGWYLLMTGSTFGLWKRLNRQADIGSLPLPSIGEALQEEAGRRIVEIASGFRDTEPTEADWHLLDEAVLGLYGLDDAERTAVRDGLTRGSWQWKAGRRTSVAPADADDLQRYALAFNSVFADRFQVAAKRLRAEIFHPSGTGPLRVLRFVAEDVALPSTIERVSPPSLDRLLTDIGRRFGVDANDQLSQRGELRLANREEVVIVKPAARRHWLGVVGLSDAWALLPGSMVQRGDTAVDHELAHCYRAGYRDLEALEAELEGWTEAGAWPED